MDFSYVELNRNFDFDFLNLMSTETYHDYASRISFGKN